MDGADDLLVEVIAVFLEDYPNSLQELRRSAAAGVAADLQRSAHTIKGAVGNFVAGPATEVAFQIEQFAKQGAMPQAVSLVDSLESEVLRLAAALSAYRDRREAA